MSDEGEDPLRPHKRKRVSSASSSDSDDSSPTTSTRKKRQRVLSEDSSEGNSGKCSICLMKFLNQEVGIPQNCEHIFCLDCIKEWSKRSNTCPVDRVPFDSIVVRACAGGRVLHTEAVKVAERRPSLEAMIDDPTLCEVCQATMLTESRCCCVAAVTAASTCNVSHLLSHGFLKADGYVRTAVSCGGPVPLWVQDP